MSKSAKFWAILNTLMFVFAAVNFFMFFSDLFTNVIVNKNVSFNYNVPFYLSTLLLVIFPTVIILSHYYKKGEKFYTILGLVQMAVSFVVLVIDIIYLTLVFEGDLTLSGPYPYYPLYTLIVSSLSIIFGICLWRTGYRINKYEDNSSSIKHPVIDTLLLLFVLAIAYFYFGDFLVRFICFDTSKNIFPMLMVTNLLLIPALEILCYLILYLSKPVEEQGKYRIIYAGFFACLTVVIFIISIICELVHPDFIVESGQALFPASFAGSLPATFIIMLLLGIILPIIIIAIEVISRKIKKNKISKQGDK